MLQTDSDATRPSEPELWRGRHDTYRVTGPVAQSTQASVYAGERLKTKHRVILKRFKAGDCRATNEGEILTLLGQAGIPGVVQILDQGIQDKSTFLVLEDLRSWRKLELNPSAPASESVLLRVMRSLANTLRACHSRQILHRDIKPSHILLSPALTGLSGGADLTPGPAERRHATPPDAKLIDFGFGTNPNNQMTQTDERAKTPPWAPPEQHDGLQHCVAQSDVFSLAASIAAFGSRTAVTSTFSFIKQIDQLRIDCSRPFYDVLRSCLAAKPDDRPDAARLLSRIDQILSPLPELKVGRSVALVDIAPAVRDFPTLARSTIEATSTDILLAVPAAREVTIGRSQKSSPVRVSRHTATTTIRVARAPARFEFDFAFDGSGDLELRIRGQDLSVVCKLHLVDK